MSEQTRNEAPMVSWDLLNEARQTLREVATQYYRILNRTHNILPEDIDVFRKYEVYVKRIRETG